MAEVSNGRPLGVRRAWVVLGWVVLMLGIAVFASVDQAPNLGPFPDAQSYADLAENLAAGDGYRVDIPGEPEGSRYSPGLPLMLAPLTWVMDVQTANALLGVALVVTLWSVAWRIGGPIAAIVATLQLMWSDAVAEDASYVMADLPTALFTVAALWAVVEERQRLAGVLVGLSAWIRVPQALVVVGLRRKAWLPFGVLIFGLGLTKLAWGWGYESGQAEWSIAAAFHTDALAGPGDTPYPNVIAYPLVLLGLQGGLLVPGAAIAAAVALWRRAGERRFVLGVVGAALVAYAPYFFQGVRFLLPSGVLLVVYAGVWVAELLEAALQRSERDAPLRGEVCLHSIDVRRAQG